MATSLHKDLGKSEVHLVYAFQYADATAREAATGFTSSDVGKLAHQQDNDTLWLLTGHDPITWVQASSVFAREAHQDSEGSQSDTTSTSFQEKLRLSLPADLPAGNYRLDWYFELQSGNNDYKDHAIARVELDDTTEIGRHQAYYTNWEGHAGFAFGSLSAGSHTVDVDFRTSSSGVTASIRKVWVEALSIPEST